MNIHQFKTIFRNQLFISGARIRARIPDLSPNNLTHWHKKGYIIRLKKDLYIFPENIDIPGIQYVCANQLYQPSYISLQSALAFHGLIPESIPHIHSVSAMKTAHFRTVLGDYFYRNLKATLIFGYESLDNDTGPAILMASSEKALLDLLYLDRMYDDPAEIEALRLDESLFEEVVTPEKLLQQAEQFKSAVLIKRVNSLLKWMES